MSDDRRRSPKPKGSGGRGGAGGSKGRSSSSRSGKGSSGGRKSSGSSRGGTGQGRSGSGSGRSGSGRSSGSGSGRTSGGSGSGASRGGSRSGSGSGSGYRSSGSGSTSGRSGSGSGSGSRRTGSGSSGRSSTSGGSGSGYRSTGSGSGSRRTSSGSGSGSRRTSSGSSSGGSSRGSSYGRDSGRSRDDSRRDGGERGGRGDYRSRGSGQGSRSRDDRSTSRGRDDAPQKKLPAGAEGLPRHVVEALMRVTPAARQNAALAALAAAAEAFGEGQYHAAVRKANNAKDLASRDSTIREILGLAAYRVGDWNTALRELRTYRRLSGETTHMPVEMDVLRAMGRTEDVEAVWVEFRRLDGGPAVKKEARVVYASYLIDIEDIEGAAEIIGRPKKIAEPWPEDLRLWYVAARIAALQGDRPGARRIADTILVEDPSFPGLDELDHLIDGN